MSDELKNYLVESLKNQLSDYRSQSQVENVGYVVELGDGVAKVNGLSQAMSLEMVAFPNDIFGVVLNLEEDLAGVIILGDYRQIKEGDMVKTTGRVLEVPVGEELIGRVINPLGVPLDEKGSLKLKNFYPVEKIAPRVIEREPVKISLQTGIKAIDAIIPIGRGQRELIIGDRQTGKTALAIDAIVNQKDQNVICVYVAIGQKDSSVAKTVAKLTELGALDHTIVVVASASESAALNYIAPFAGSAMAEYFKDQGKDVLIVYDDLSKHAVSYRQLSLLLRRPPGREAYPGDIFYLHSRLLERACKISQEKGGGSITALPIIETQAGDISAYIPTNVISITDGQIFLEGDLFYQGIRPALNVGLSVSRVGSVAQIKAMKKVAGKLRLELAQFRELAAFVQFASDLDKSTQAQIERGMRLTEILKQEQYCPMPVERQVAILYAAVNGFLDDIEVSKIKDFEAGLLQYLDNQGQSIWQCIKETKDITEPIEEELKKLIGEYKSVFLS